MTSLIAWLVGVFLSQLVGWLVGWLVGGFAQATNSSAQHFYCTQCSKYTADILNTTAEASSKTSANITKSRLTTWTNNTPATGSTTPNTVRLLSHYKFQEGIYPACAQKLYDPEVSVADCVWNVKAHAQKPDFVFRRNGRVHLNRRGRQFSRLLAAEVCESAVVMLDTPCSEVVWRVLATHYIRQFSLHFPPCVTVCHHISTGLYLPNLLTFSCTRHTSENVTIFMSHGNSSR